MFEIFVIFLKNTGIVSLSGQCSRFLGKINVKTLSKASLKSLDIESDSSKIFK